MSTDSSASGESPGGPVGKWQWYLDAHCADRLGELVEDEGGPLYIEWDDIYQEYPALAEDYVEEYDQVSDAFGKAIDGLENDLTGGDVVLRVTDTEDAMFRHRVTELNADLIGRFIAVEGQLSKVSEVTHRFEEIAFECGNCGQLAYIPQPPTRYQEPHECAACERGGAWTQVEDESSPVDRRTLKLESPPGERVRSMPDKVVAYAEKDLCWFGGDNGLPDMAGQRVVILGRYRVDKQQLNQGSVPAADGYLEAEAIVSVEEDFENITVEETLGDIERLSDVDDPVELLTESLAPSLYKTDELGVAMEAAVAYLFNGYRMEPPDGDDIRGDLHIGYIGDPATGKSTLLSDIDRISPKSVYRSGGSISEVGLTAAAKQEEFAGETQWTLEPGVLVRANGGHALVDEADALVEKDSTKAIHDALEGQQLVKVDKAGISADLPSRSALCISGNPSEGRFNPHEAVAEQLDMDPALISRMDVLLPVTDKVDKDLDEKKAETQISYIKAAQEAQAEKRETGEEPEPDDDDREVSIQVFRDWVYHARENIFPVLTEESAEMIQQVYLEARDLNDGYSSGGPASESPVSATARVLGAGVRLSTAFARVELSETIEPRHVERSERILKTSIGMNYDKESGAFDVDGKGHATPKSSRDRIAFMKQSIEQRIAEFEDEGGVPEEVLIDMAEDAGVDRAKAGHTLTKLRKRGEIYEPSMDDHYRVS